MDDGDRASFAETIACGLTRRDSLSGRYRAAENSLPTKHVVAAGRPAMGRGFNSRRLHHPCLHHPFPRVRFQRDPPILPFFRRNVVRRAAEASLPALGRDLADSLTSSGPSPPFPVVSRRRIFRLPSLRGGRPKRGIHHVWRSAARAFLDDLGCSMDLDEWREHR